jgi:prepilin-type N-terminal cleavage/methylation domain-containing protein
MKNTRDAKRSTLNANDGFTIIEVLIAIAIIGVLASLTIAYFNSFLSRNELKNESIKIVDALRRARGQSMAGQSDSQWGVHFESNKYVLFQGNTFTANDSFNEETTLAEVLTISSINLNGGGSNVVFSKINGETTQFGTTTIQNDIGETKNIVINAYGNVEIR